MMGIESDNAGGLLIKDDEHYKRLCSDLACSHTLDEFQQRIFKQVNSLGFTEFLFLRLERCWQIGSGQGLLSSLPAMWMQRYQESRMNEIDLVLSYGKSNIEPIFSSQIYGYIDGAPFDMPLTRDNRNVLHLYKQFGYFEHYIIPLPAFNDHGHVLLILTCTGMESQEFQAKVAPIMSACRILCRAIDSVSTQRFNTSFIQRSDRPIDITPKQLKLLRYMANEDYSIKGLAALLCISPITAHQHVAAARKALHVDTNVRAVVKAIKAGLITIY